MVKFLDLPRQRSTGDKLMEGLGLASQSIGDLIGTYEKSKSFEKIGATLPKEQKAIWDSLDNDTKAKMAPGIFTAIRQKDTANQKNIDESRKYLSTSLPKSVFNKYGDKIDPIYKQNLQNGMTRDEARDAAVSQVTGKGKGPTPGAAQGLGWQDLLGVSGSLFKGGEGQQEGSQGSPLDFLTGERSQDPESALRKGMGGDLERAKIGAKALAPTALGFAEQAGTLGLLPLLQRESPRLTLTDLLENKKPFKSEKYFDLPSEKIAEKIMEGMTPEQKEQFLQDVEVQGLTAMLATLGPAAAKSIAKSLSKGPKAISPNEILPPERAAPKALTQKPPAQKINPVSDEATLKGRVTEAPETATEKRVERAKPEARVYPRLENVELREKQLKNFPKYVEEINTDAGERAARTEKRVPKTVKGMDSQRIRIHEAEKQYPIAQESYNKSAGRVRALEDEVVKLKGEARERGETLLELARKDLEDATYNLKQAYENLTGVNVRAGIESSRTAARNKIEQIQDSISKGEEYKIAKMDYSPDLIAKANAISKSKSLPKARQSDFYTQIHDIYANEYRNRVAQIDKELKALPKTMEGLSNARPLHAEKDILNKMIKSAEAEKTIQNRRFGLREMAERHKAQERFKKLEKDGAKPEVSKVAQEKMWKTRIEEAKTPEKRAAVIDEAVEQIANENPEQAEKIRAEGERLKDTIEDMFKPREPKEPPSSKGEKTRFREETKQPPPSPPKPSGKQPPKAPKKPAEAKTWAKNFINHYKNKFKELKNSFPYIWNSELGRDFIVGVGTAAIDEATKSFDLDIPLTGGQVASLALGKMRGSGHRLAINALTKWVIKKIKESNEIHSYINS